MLFSPVFIPIVAIIGGLAIAAFGMWLKHREKMGNLASDDALLSREIDALKERVAALETIVTSSKEQLKREIDSL